MLLKKLLALLPKINFIILLILIIIISIKKDNFNVRGEGKKIIGLNTDGDLILTDISNQLSTGIKDDIINLNKDIQNMKIEGTKTLINDNGATDLTNKTEVDREIGLVQTLLDDYKSNTDVSFGHITDSLYSGPRYALSTGNQLKSGGDQGAIATARLQSSLLHTYEDGLIKGIGGLSQLNPETRAASVATL